MARHIKLTKREWEVLRHIVQDHENSEARDGNTSGLFMAKKIISKLEAWTGKDDFEPDPVMANIHQSYLAILEEKKTGRRPGPSLAKPISPLED
jgi:hypothetical protein